MGVTPSSCIAILPLTLNDPTRKELRGRGLWGELRNIVKVVKRPKVRRILFMFSYDAFTWSVIGPFAAIYYVRAFNASPYDLATVNLIINVISLAGFPLSGALSDKAPFLALSEALGALSLALMLCAKELYLIYVASAFLALVISFWSPVASTLITEAAEEGVRSWCPAPSARGVS